MILALPISASLITIGIQRAKRVQPAFYSEALTREPVEVDTSILLAQLDEEIESHQQWTANLTDDQINSWLSSELEKEFPSVLPKAARSPRVKIEDGKILLACQIVTSKTRAIFSVELHTKLTNRKNELEVEMRRPRLGVLPIPMNSYQRHLAKAAKRAKIAYRWPDDQRNSIILQLPKNRKGIKRGIIVESLIVTTGAMQFTGSSDQTLLSLALND